MNLQKLFLNIENTTISDISHIDFDLQELIILEKQRLGFDDNKLVFISAGDLSRFYWCPMQTYFSLIDHELDKFSGYLQDKIEYSIKLNKLKQVPKTKQQLLSIGDDINLDDIFELLKQEEYQNKVSDKDIQNAKQELKKCKLPQEKGHHLETIYAKKYPQIHWVTKYDDFIFTCAPDGIGNDFVYEFKSSKNRYFSKQSIQKAKLQADMYCICFNKKIKVIDQLILSENKIESIEEKVDINTLNEILTSIRHIIKGNFPNPPKERFKCINCEYKSKCTIKNN